MWPTPICPKRTRVLLGVGALIFIAGMMPARAVDPAPGGWTADAPSVVSGAGVLSDALPEGTAAQEVAGDAAVNIDPQIAVSAPTPVVDMGTVQTGKLIGYIPWRIEANTQNIAVWASASYLYKGDDPTSSAVPPILLDLGYGIHFDIADGGPVGGEDNVLDYINTVTIDGFPGMETSVTEYESSTAGHLSQNCLMSVQWDQSDNEKPMGQYSGRVRLCAMTVDLVKGADTELRVSPAAQETCAVATPTVIVGPNISAQPLGPDIDMGSVDTGTFIGYIPWRIDANTEKIRVWAFASYLYKGGDPTDLNVPPIQLDQSYGIQFDIASGGPTGGEDNVLDYISSAVVNGFPGKETSMTVYESSTPGYLSQNCLMKVQWDQSDPAKPTGDYIGIVRLSAMAELDGGVAQKLQVSPADLSTSATHKVFIRVNPNIAVTAPSPDVNMGTIETGKVVGYLPWRVDGNTQNMMVWASASNLYKGDNPADPAVPPILLDPSYGIRFDMSAGGPVYGGDNILEYINPVVIDGFPGMETSTTEYQSSTPGHITQDCFMSVRWDQPDPQKPAGEYYGRVRLSAMVVDFKDGSQKLGMSPTEVSSSATARCFATVDPDGACCDHVTGACAITRWSACSFTWLGTGATCSVAACPVPDGSCCDAVGVCTVTTQAGCIGNWTIDGACTPNPCPPTMTEEKSWGEIKSIYR